jgi:hypothetical protein
MCGCFASLFLFSMSFVLTIIGPIKSCEGLRDTSTFGKIFILHT